MGILSAQYTGSFDSVQFWEQDSSGWHAQKGVSTEGAVQHTPASSDNSFHQQGEGAQFFDLTVGVEGTEYSALLSKRGDTGTLVYSGGSISVTLLGITDSPGKAGNLDAYTIVLHFTDITDIDRPQLSVQVDSATSPAHSITDITDYLLSFDVELSTEADNGSATVQLKSLPGSADEGNRLYIYADGDLLFNGFIPDGGTGWNSDDTVVLSCVDALFKLRNAWGGEDRTYGAANVPPSTDTNTAQNVVEAAGVDSSLTSIEGEDRPIGTAQDVIIRGGSLDLEGNPSGKDVLIDFIRLLDKSVIPNYATFTRGNGAVYRRPREIGSSVASFSESNAWGWDRKRQPGSIINKWLVKGLTIADVPTEAEASDANALLTAPWEFNTEEFSSYLVDDPAWAQDLADWKLADTNGRLNVVSWTTKLNTNEAILGSTVTVTSSARSLSSQEVYVTSVKHHVDSTSAYTQFSAIFRD